ncbi:MAG: uroporphyrinogen-III C-methyltransferase [Alphaproteobacteria bacterium]|nr:uroporphyrinogen-III C-methyltransferase [Alphaproteobacteria bacterium]
MSGFVSFVSSGPGDPELLTLKAVNRLKKADAILFDDLSSGPILQHARADADLIGVGKRANRPSPKQHAVSQLLVEYAKNGGQIVRLKSGDAGVFGRLEEEISALREAGISYEIIPGVSSAFAASAAAGIPMTRRLSARRIQFITGRDITGELPDDFNLPALADPSAITVVFMGKKTFSKMQKLLAEHGLSDDTPALLAEAVAPPEQTLKRTTISKLAKLLDSDSSPNPALILYGPLADMDDSDDN